MLEPDRTVDYYKIIGCEPMDDDASIKKAYRALGKLTGPTQTPWTRADLVRAQP